MKNTLILLYFLCTASITSSFYTPIYYFLKILNLHKLNKFIIDNYLYSKILNSLSYFISNFINFDINIYGDTIDINSKQNLFIFNNCFSVDFIFIINLISNFFDSKNIKFMLLDTLKYICPIGAAGFVKNYLFMKRNYKNDLNEFNKILKFKENNYCLAMCPEGTRINKKKLLFCQKYSKEKNYPIYNNVLLPKYKGLYKVFDKLDGNIDYIYDATIYFDNSLNEKTYNLYDFFIKNHIKKISIYIKKYNENEVPYKNENELKHWIHTVYSKKDELLMKTPKKWNNFQKTLTFNKYFYDFILVNIFSISQLYLIYTNSYVMWYYLISILFQYTIIYIEL